MKDPYSVLGVSRNASDEEIKDAYRHLAQKYSAADYVGDPMADMAAQHMRELNEAYDAIMAERLNAQQASFYNSSARQSADRGGYQQTNEATSDPVYRDIRARIHRGDFLSAEQILLAIDGRKRTSEWYFLMGSVCQHKGWLDEAYRYYQKASAMDPANREYAAACDNMASQRRSGTGYSPYGQQQSTQYSGCSDDCCSFLQCYCCSSMCCDACCH